MSLAQALQISNLRKAQVFVAFIRSIAKHLHLSEERVVFGIQNDGVKGRVIIERDEFPEFIPVVVNADPCRTAFYPVEIPTLL